MYQNQKVQIDKLKSLTCKFFELNLDEFYTDGRRVKGVDARRSFFHILKTYHGIPELNISRLINGIKDRTTIMYAVDTADDFLGIDFDFANKYRQVYEEYTKTKFERTIPLKRRVGKPKKNIDYSYMTDSMILSTTIPSEMKCRYLSDEFKENIKQSYHSGIVPYQIWLKYRVSKRLLNYLLTA